jgi:5-methylcytosine-specific restriction protein A
VLERDPLCVVHLERGDHVLATVADHYPRSRRELEALGLDPNDPEYGRGLCASCHSRETARHQPGGWNIR